MLSPRKLSGDARFMAMMHREHERGVSFSPRLSCRLRGIRVVARDCVPRVFAFGADLRLLIMIALSNRHIGDVAMTALSPHCRGRINTVACFH